jgi:hypothetical protein
VLLLLPDSPLHQAHGGIPEALDTRELLSRLYSISSDDVAALVADASVTQLHADFELVVQASRLRHRPVAELFASTSPRQLPRSLRATYRPYAPAGSVGPSTLVPTTIAQATVPTHAPLPVHITLPTHISSPAGPLATVRYFEDETTQRRVPQPPSCPRPKSPRPSPVCVPAAEPGRPHLLLSDDAVLRVPHTLPPCPALARKSPDAGRRPLLPPLVPHSPAMSSRAVSSSVNDLRMLDAKDSSAAIPPLSVKSSLLSVSLCSIPSAMRGPAPPAPPAPRPVSRLRSMAAAVLSLFGSSRSVVTPRSVRGVFSVATTSTRAPEEVRQDILRVLHEMRATFDEDGFRIRSSLRRVGEDVASVTMELEVCTVAGIGGVTGIRLKRIRGDTWSYNRACQALLGQLRL